MQLFAATAEAQTAPTVNFNVDGQTPAAARRNRPRRRARFATRARSPVIPPRLVR